ncbi:MFS transporter [Serratia fonticola]|nr:MFS transporter [Serratia fonticola]
MKIDPEIRKLLHSCSAMNAIRMVTGSFHVFFLFSMGVSVSQIAILQMVFSISIFTFELPTGILGDKLGVKQNVILSCLFYALFFPLCTFAPNMYILVIAEVCYALGACFCSGADSTWIKGLVDKLPDKNKESNIYHHYMSYVREVNALMNSVSGVIGVIIVILIGSYNAAYYLCGASFLLLMLFFSKVESVTEKKDIQNIKARFNVYLHTKEAMQLLVSTKVGIYYILICGFVVAAMQPVFHFWQPFILSQTGLLDNATKNQEIIILGGCFFSYSFTKYLFNRYLRKSLLAKYNPMKITLWATILAAISMFALIFIKGQWAPIVIFTLFHSFFSVPMSQFDSEFFKCLNNNNSNTVLSIVSLLARVFGIVSLLIIGVMAESLPLSSAFVFSLICILSVIPITIAWIRYINKIEEGKGKIIGVME